MSARIANSNSTVKETREANVLTPAEQTTALGRKFSGVTLEDLEVFCEMAREAELPSNVEVRIANDSPSSTAPFNRWRISTALTMTPEEWAAVDKADQEKRARTWGEMLHRVRAALRMPDGPNKLTAVYKAVGDR